MSLGINAPSNQYIIVLNIVSIYVRISKIFQTRKRKHEPLKQHDIPELRSYYRRNSDQKFLAVKFCRHPNLQKKSFNIGE